MLNVIVVYLIEALAIAIAAYYIPRRVMSLMDILKIALTGAMVHLLLDLYSPLVASGLRFGSGMSMGKNMINNPVSLFGGKKGGVNEEEFTNSGNNPAPLEVEVEEPEPLPVQDPNTDLCKDICEADAECMTICNEAFRE